MSEDKWEYMSLSWIFPYLYNPLINLILYSEVLIICNYDILKIQFEVTFEVYFYWRFLFMRFASDFLCQSCSLIICAHKMFLIWTQSTFDRYGVIQINMKSFLTHYDVQNHVSMDTFALCTCSILFLRAHKETC